MQTIGHIGHMVRRICRRAITPRERQRDELMAQASDMPPGCLTCVETMCNTCTVYLVSPAHRIQSSAPSAASCSKNPLQEKAEIAERNCQRECACT